MKKTITFLLAMTVLLSLCGAAFAVSEEETQPPEASAEPSPSEAPSPNPTPSPASAVRLEIDAENVYPGMASAYNAGYIPTVSDGTATIILPLIASGNLKGEEITVTPDLGATSNSPFVYGNYRKTVTQGEFELGGKKQSAYLVRFDIPLAGGRSNGVYPVTITAEGQSEGGAAVTRTFTVYVTISDGKDPNYVPEPEVISQPKVIVQSADIIPETIEAGKEFEVTVHIKNTSAENGVYNMTATARCDSVNFTSLNDSDVTFIDSISAGSTSDMVLRYKTDASAPGGKYVINIEFAYESSKGQSYMSTGAVTVKVEQPLELELTMPQIPNSAAAGETIPLSFQVMNLSRGAAYNVRCEISGFGLFPSGSAFIGNMEAGTEGSGKTNLFFGSLTMSENYCGEEEYGYTSGTVTLKYENADGKEFTREELFNIEITPPASTEKAPEIPEEQPETAGQWWVTIVIGALIAAAAIAGIVIDKRRKRK